MNNLKKITLAVVMILVALMAVSCAQGGIGHKHNLKKVEKLDATCTEAGYAAYYECDGCDAIFSDVDGAKEIEAPKAIAPLGHKIVGVAGNEASCASAGSKDCYQCVRCETLFSDAKGENKIDAAESIPALSHSLVKTEAKEVSCTEDGNKAYWTCNNCNKVYSDAEGKTETTLAEQIVKSNGHTLTKTEAKAATCTSDGNVAYWSCGGCGKVYSDAEGKTETTLENIVDKADGHAYSETLVVEGAVTEYEPDSYFSTTGLTVKLDCVNCEHYETVTDYTVSNTNKLQPTDTEVVISCTVDGKTYSATVNITVKHEHTTGDQVAKVDPTCTEKGALAYYECTVCHDKFEDKAATKPLASIEVPAKGHSGVKTDASAPSCTTEGNNAYWTCSECGKVFSDENCTIETTVEAEKLPVSDHDTEIKSDSEGHWEDCKDCEYVTDKAAHTGVAYPDAAAICTVCGTSFSEASSDGWVHFAPGKDSLEHQDEVISGNTVAGNDYFAFEHITLDNGLLATKVTIKSGAPENASTMLWNGDCSHNSRVPVRQNGTHVIIYVTNNGDADMTISFGAIDWSTDKGSGTVLVPAGETKSVAFKINSGAAVGNNAWFAVRNAVEADTDLTVWGYFNVEDDVKELSAKTSASKLSFVPGDKFTVDGLRLLIASKNDGATADYSEVEIYSNFTTYMGDTNLDGYTFTSNDIGVHTVTVSFAGATYTYSIEVSDPSHEHNPQLVEKKLATCTEAGYEAYYVCNVSGCGQLFADADGNTPITEITVLPAGHISSAALPGAKAVCSRCGEENGEVRDPDGWIHFVPSKYTGISATHDTVNGMMATVYTIPAGTAANTKYNFETHKDDGDCANGNYQVRIPLQGERKVIVYFKNLSSIDATVKFGDDTFALGNTTVTVLGNGFAVAEFTLNGNTVGPWMGMQILSNVPADEDLKLAVYGYFYVEEEETGLSGLKINAPASTLTFKAGETFSAEGLILGASHITPLYIRTGYTTDLDGYVFTAEDEKVGTKTVTVTFAGVTTTYNITVGEVEEIDPDDMKIAFKPSHALGGATDVVSAADTVLENGLHATVFTFAAGAKNGAEISTWPSSVGNDPNAYGYNVRVPGTGTDRKLELVVTNNGNEAITFYYYAENGGDCGGVEVTLAAGETKTVQFTANYNSEGCNYNLKLLSDLTTGTSVTIYGYVYYSDGELTSISINGASSHKTAYKVGEAFDAYTLTVDCNGLSNFYDSNIENYTTSIAHGYVFTAADVGEKEITVSFNGLTTTYTVTVTAE